MSTAFFTTVCTSGINRFVIVWQSFVSNKISNVQMLSWEWLKKFKYSYHKRGCIVQVWAVILMNLNPDIHSSEHDINSWPVASIETSFYTVYWARCVKKHFKPHDHTSNASPLQDFSSHCKDVCHAHGILYNICKACRVYSIYISVPPMSVWWSSSPFSF